MRIEFTTEADGRREDVAVTAPTTASVEEVGAAVAATLRGGGRATLWLGDRALPGAADLGTAGLRTGSLVGLDHPVPTLAQRAVLCLLVGGGPDSGRVIPLERGRLVIGRDAGADLRLRDPDVSRRHAEIEVGAAVVIRDLGSSNGTYLDGERLGDESVVVRPGAVLRLGDSLLTVAGPEESPAVVQSGADGSVQVLRPPRADAGVDAREVTLPTRDAHGRPRGVQWISALLPAVAGAALAWFAHSPQFLLFALLSPLMILSTSLGDRVHWRRTRRREAATFRRRRLAAEREVLAGLRVETAARRRAAPDPASLQRIAGLPGNRLWERRPCDPDFLRVRIGTADLPSTLLARDGAVTRPADVLPDVPLCVDLASGPLGVAGPAEVVDGVAPWLVGQLATLHAPTELELVLVLSATRAAQWQWSAWLPHLRGRVATSTQQRQAVTADLTATIEQRRAVARGDGRRWSGPWLVMVVDRAADLGDIAGLTALLRAGPEVGVTALCIGEHVGDLPSPCATVAQVCGETGTRVRVQGLTDAERPGVLDRVTRGWADQLARSLAPLVDATVTGAATLPGACTLLDVLGLPAPDAREIARRWAGSDGAARATLGVGADGPLTVDLVAEGPHALVAGTTGSGKSELLQTLVVTLAVNHPPDELNVLLVDYKGGAAFSDCARLPHTAGLVTDLDPYLTERALRSLQSELRRRERLFAHAGATDLAGYRATRPTEAVPRLVIVVDEFATLAQELPEFVRGLIGVAQRGRSLGVHLVLATQRPGSAVSAEIRANTALRIALRVTDVGDSNEVIDAPDAAGIAPTTPGRAYLRAGAALVCFQTAQAGAASGPPSNQVQVEVLGPWRRPAPRTTLSAASDLAQLVQAIRGAAEQAGHRAAVSPWLAPLPEALPQSSLEKAATARRDGFVPLARVDLPDEQRQAAAGLDLAAGDSLLIAGAARSGRTQALASAAVAAAEQWSPDELQLYVVDAAGPLAQAMRGLPHAATVLGPDDANLTARLLARLAAECVGDPVDAGAVARLLLVDGWDRLVGGLPDLDAGQCTDLLTQLLRIGPPARLSVIVAGDRGTLTPRFSAGFATKILLRLSERTDYSLAGIATRDVPERMPPGRGLRAGDGAAVQFAHAGDHPGLAEAQRCAGELAGRWPANNASGASGAIRIRPLPSQVALVDLPATGPAFAIGLAGDQRDCLRIDPFTGAGRLLVAGPPRSGRSTVLHVFVRQAQAAGIATVVAAPHRSPLAATARALGMPLVQPDSAEVGPVPAGPTLLLVDDSEAFADAPAGAALAEWLRDQDTRLAAVVAGRSDDLATTYRGIGAEVRRSHCGILLRPGPVDGELLGVRLPRRPSSGPPGRGVAVGDPTWGPPFDAGEPVPVQVAMP